MNPNVTKFLPPGLVVMATLYFGWPPSRPLIQSDATVRATAVRWKPDDLASRTSIEVSNDPFASVLVVSDQHEVEEETGKLIPATRPAGPHVSELKNGLSLTGIAQMAGRRWAILNGRPRRPGDQIRTDDNHRHSCEIVSVAADHVIVRCEETIAKIEISLSGYSTTTPGNHEPPQDGVPKATHIPPPPNFMESLGSMPPARITPH